MIKVSKLADYAVVVLASLAGSNDALMTASGVSMKTGLPEPTVAKVLKMLAREDILQSSRGASGGYKLAAPPEKISIAKIIGVIDGPISITSCADGSTQICGFESRCAVKGRWNGVNRAIGEALESVTLADMMNNQMTRVAAE